MKQSNSDKHCSTKTLAITSPKIGDLIQVPSRVLREEPCYHKALPSFKNFINNQAAANAALMMKNTKYKPARLVIPPDTAKDQRWYILVYTYDSISGINKRKRIYQITGNTPEQKKVDANQKIQIINQALQEGYNFSSQKQIAPNTEVHQSLHSEIQKYIKARAHTRSSGERLKSYIKPYLDFCEIQKCLNIPITQFTYQHAIAFDVYLKSKGYSNRTINNYMSYAKTIWHEIEDQQDIPTPFKKIKKLPVSIGKNLAFKPEQIALITAQHKKYPDLELLAKFMYYTLARTNELALMQVQHIGMFNKQQLYIPAENSKNQHQRHINIPDHLYQLILQRKILTYPQHHYVLAVPNTRGNKYNKYKPLEPSPHFSLSKRIGARYRKYILDPLGFDKDYTLYSWKHTGVINAHRAGVSDADIMQQTGHRNYESFTKYMKSLGLFAEGQFAAKIPEI